MRRLLKHRPQDIVERTRNLIRCELIPKKPDWYDAAVLYPPSSKLPVPGTEIKEIKSQYGTLKDEFYRRNPSMRYEPVRFYDEDLPSWFLRKWTSLIAKGLEKDEAYNMALKEFELMRYDQYKTGEFREGERIPRAWGIEYVKYAAETEHFSRKVAEIRERIQDIQDAKYEFETYKKKIMMQERKRQVIENRTKDGITSSTL